VVLIGSSASESLSMQKVRQQQVKRNLEQVKLDITLVFISDFNYFCCSILYLYSVHLYSNILSAVYIGNCSVVCSVN